MKNERNFDIWNAKKKQVQKTDNDAYFREGEVWWAKIGINIGYEMDGKGDEFARPVLIIKKYNQFSFLGMPLTTANGNGKYIVPLGDIEGKQAFVSLSQIKYMDSRRLINKICSLNTANFALIKKKASKINFS